MPSVQHVKSARKAQGTCDACGEGIGVGVAYKHWSSFRGPKNVRHESCPDWRESQMATGGRATALAAQEDATDSLNDLGNVYTPEIGNAWIEDVRGVMTQAAEGAEEAKGEFEESYENLPEAFQQGPAGEALQEKIDALDTWIDALGSFEPLDDNPMPEDGDTNETWDEWRDAIVTAAQEVVDELDLP